MVMAARLGSSMWQSRHRTVHLIGSRASRYWRFLSVSREPISTRSEAFPSFIKWTPLLVLGSARDMLRAKPDFSLIFRALFVIPAEGVAAASVVSALNQTDGNRRRAAL